ncbi:MAG TPA: hypothetical protein EYN91_25930 [Candidatus Melainabacteria bacterium]|nr:hypothetical protein [Candidatus Melainabacteria bacterium]HIN66671.1 hypothetical protein [Candidatus Obscuribacterales bacterium]
MEERQEHLSMGGLAGQFTSKDSLETKEASATPELRVSSEYQEVELLPATATETADQPTDTLGDIARAIPSKRTRASGEEGFEPLTKLPRLGLLLFITLTVSFFVSAIANAFTGWSIWFYLPLVIYFAHCIWRLSQISGLKTATRPPLSAHAVTMISLVTLGFFPAFGLFYHFPDRLHDPFFWLWMAAQTVWPIMISHRIERAAKPSSLIVGLVAALPILAIALFPVALRGWVFFLPIWVMSQFTCLVYLSTRLRQVFINDLKIVNARVAAQRAQVKGVSKDDIVVRYRPYAAVERWIRQRFTGGELVKGMQLLFLWVSVPVVILLLLFGLTVLDTVLGTSTASSEHIPKGVAQAAAKLNGTFLQGFLGVSALLVGLPLFTYLLTPTHVLFNKHGMRFLWRHAKYAKDGAELAWKDLKAIDLKRAPGSTKALDQDLCFEGIGKKSLLMKLSAFDTAEDREKILAMIRNWAPNVPRPPEVEQCLEPPANHSYTEMWLQALAAPPKRERLKPLMDGASVQAGKYRVINQLGVGGQGSAYLASDNINEHVVVLKEFILPVHVDVNVRKSALESFENEARILKQMDSPNVVKLIDFFVEDHRAYLVLEHIDGMSLRELVEKNGAMKESQVKELALQMCYILSYLHSLSPPVVHRDFTPDNLILQRDGTLKLIDFNVAQQVEATVTGTVVGKHAYLPPEQFRGMPTSQSDIYACGATLHFLLTGADPEPISQSHPAKQVPNLSKGMDHIVAHATQLDIGQRYDQIDEMAKDLKALT